MSASGSILGGTDVTIRGKQFIEGMAVWFGDVESLLVQYIDESTIIARAPAGVAAGAVDITIIQYPGGVEKTISGGFIYTDGLLLTEDGFALATEDGYDLELGG